MKRFFLAFLLGAILWPAGFAKADDIKTEQAIFAAGCFWCIEKDMEAVPGVIDVVSGYTGGTTKNPTYKDVTTQTTGHYEAVRVTYDPKKVSYARLMQVFWDNHDPFDPEGQFCDKGFSYRGAVFALNEAQKRIAEDFIEAQRAKYQEKIITPVLDAREFYPAEEYHQNYYKKNPTRYKYYRWNCGRDQVLENLKEQAE